MHIPKLLLLLAIPRNSSPNRPQRPLRAILNPLSEILQLALRLLLLARGVLLHARAPQALVADQVAQRFLGRTDGLVPGAGRTVRVVFGRCAGIGVSGDRT